MGGYVESGRVYLNPDGSSTLLIKCCLCSTSTFSGNQWEAFVGHLSSHHTSAREVNDDEIQDEVLGELENLKEAGMTESLVATHGDDEQEEFTNVEYLIEEDEFHESEQEYLNHSEFDKKNDSITICGDCNRQFLSEHQLQLHKFRFHQGPNPNVCLICQKGFPNASKLRQHQERYHLKTLKWQCHQCDYNAPSKWDFQQHQIMHSGLRNYICDVCGQSCKTSSALAVHRRKHEPPKLGCTYCNRKFWENYTLRSHLRKVHKREPSLKRYSSKEIEESQNADRNFVEDEDQEDIDDPTQL